MRNWASFESAISTPSAPNYSFPTSNTPNITSPTISPRNRTTNPSFFSTPATPSSSSVFPSTSSHPFSSPPLLRPASSSVRPPQSPFPHVSSSSTAYTSSVPPSTPASARPTSYVGSSSTPTTSSTPLPFSTYRTFPSLSGRKDTTTATTTATSTTTPHTSHDSGVRYMRSLAGVGGGVRRGVVFGGSSGLSLSTLSSAALSGAYASVQSLLHGSTWYAQYIVWKVAERQTKLTAFLCYYCPLLLLLLCLFAFHLSHYSTLLVFACTLSLVLSHSVRSLLSAHVLTAARPLRPAWQRLLVPFVSSDDVVVACATLLCSVVTVVALSWLSSPRSTADSSSSGSSDYTRQLMWFTLCSASAFEVWWLFHHLPIPLRPTPASSIVDVRHVLHSCVLPALSTSVASAARVVVVSVVVFSVCRVLVCVELGMCASATAGWLQLPATLLRLFRIVFSLRLCSTLSYRLLALFLSRSTHFELPYLLLALYDHYDSLSRYLSFSFLSSFLTSPSNRTSLLVPLSSILPDIRPSPSAPAATAIDAVVTAALHTIVQWVAGRKRSVLEVQRAAEAETVKERADAASRQQRLWWVERARALSRLLLWQELEAEVAAGSEGGELDSSEVVAAAASILASLLATLENDRQRLIEPYVSHVLSALSELADTCAVVGGGVVVSGLGSVAEENFRRAAVALKSRLAELELPAKYRERVERTLRQQS